MANGVDNEALPVGVEVCPIDDRIFRQADNFAAGIIGVEFTFRCASDTLPPALLPLAKAGTEQAGQHFNTTVVSRLRADSSDGLYKWRTAPEGYVGKMAIAPLQGLPLMGVESSPKFVRCDESSLVVVDVSEAWRFIKAATSSERRMVTFGFFDPSQTTSS